jgi:phosphotriesterase-related protein
MPKLITTLGDYQAEQLGMILPHEHIFVDLGPQEEENWKRARAEDVVALMAPELRKARSVGVTALVECTPLGVGRRADLVKAVSIAANFPIVLPTGIYRQPWVPQWAVDASQGEIRDWMVSELSGEIDGCGVRAAWIKLSAGDDGITPVEKKILRAAAQAGRQTDAVIGSHTIRGSVVREQLDILEEEGYTPERFIWIHTQAEEELDIHLEIARRGAWLEYDSIGGEWTTEEHLLSCISQILEAGFGDQLLLSHDRGWYDPSQPGGGIPKPFIYLSEVFIPKLRDSGIDERIILQLTHHNPFRAFAR